MGFLGNKLQPNLIQTLSNWQLLAPPSQLLAAIPVLEIAFLF